MPSKKGSKKEEPKEVDNDTSSFKVKVEEEETNETEAQTPEVVPEEVVVEEPSDNTEPSSETIEAESDEIKTIGEPEPETIAGPEPVQEVAQPTQSKKSGVSFISLFLAFFLSLIIGGALVGGLFYYQNNVANKEDSTDVDETPAPAYTPPAETPSPDSEVEDTEEIDLTTYSVQVLNGSGTSGEASKVEVLLIDVGFEEIETGNASSYDYTETEVSVKEDLSSMVLSEVTTALEDSYVISEGQSLDEDNEYDVVIIVGSESPEDTASEEEL